MATYKKMTVDGSKVQVESAIRDGNGKNIANNYVKHNSYDITLHSGMSDQLYTEYGATDTPENDTSNNPFDLRKTGGNVSALGDYAELSEVRGRTWVENQLVQNGNFASDSIWIARYGTLLVSGNVGTYTMTQDNSSARIQQNINTIAGHKYFYTIDIKFSSNGKTSILTNGNVYLLNSTEINDTNWHTFNGIVPITSDGTIIYFYNNDVGTREVGDTTQYRNLNIIDLTQWYGAGREPTSVADFRKDFHDTYIPYNLGQVKSLSFSGIKTIGFNLWDEEWEVGYISDTTGEEYPSQTRIRMKNYMRVLPNTTYYRITDGVSWGAWYDKDKKFISGIGSGNILNSPSNAMYYRATIYNKATYNHDICINFSNANLNGTYKAHEHWIKPLSLGELNGIGTAYDTINKNKKVVRIGKVDLGTLNWDNSGSYFSSSELQVATYESTENVKPNIFNIKYSTYETKYWGTFTSVADDKIITIAPNKKQIFIHDTSYNDATQFKNSLSGIYLYYELATPIETTHETLSLTYNIAPNGSEEYTETNARVPCEILYANDLKTKLEGIQPLTSQQMTNLINIIKGVN